LSLKRDSIALFSAKLISGLVSIFSVALLSRFLDIADYGLYRQWIVVTSFFTSVLSFGFPAAITYFLPRVKTQKEETLWLTNIIFSIATISVVFVLSTPLVGYAVASLFSNDTLFKYNYLLTLSVAISLLIQIFPNLFIVKKNTRAILLFAIAPNVIWFLILIFLVILKVSLEAYVFALLIKPVLDLFIGCLYSGRIFRFQEIDWKFVKDIMKFSLPLGLSAIVGTIMLYTDKFVVGSMLTPKEFAVFVNGAYEIPFIGLITASLFTVLTPRLTKAFFEERFETVRMDWMKAGKTLIPIMISISCVIVFFAEPVVLALYSEKYLEAVPLFMVYQSMGVIRIYSYSSLFVASGKTKLYLLNVILSASLNLLLDIIMVRSFGAIGAALATVISTFVLMALQIFQVKNITKSRKFSDTFPFNSFFGSICLSSIIVGCVFLIARFVSGNLIVQFCFAFIAFLCSFYVLSKIVSNDIMKALFSILRDFSRKFLKRGIR